MKTKKVLVAFLGLAFLIVFSTATARAEDECCVFNPLLLPFVAVTAAVGTAAAIVTAPFYPYPYYYGPAYYPPAYYPPTPPPGPYYGYGPYAPRVWVRGHTDKDGNWIPGHWRRARWIAGHKNQDGVWIRGHWG